MAGVSQRTLVDRFSEIPRLVVRFDPAMIRIKTCRDLLESEKRIEGPLLVQRAISRENGGGKFPRRPYRREGNIPYGIFNCFYGSFIIIAYPPLYFNYFLSF
jgi:hypothetical protein